MSYIGIELSLDSLSELNRFGQHLHCHCDSFALTLWADPSAFDENVSVWSFMTGWFFYDNLGHFFLGLLYDRQGDSVLISWSLFWASELVIL